MPDPPRSERASGLCKRRPVLRRASALTASAARQAARPLRGLGYPLRGARFVYLEHPSLARIWIVPVLLTALLAAGLLWLAWTQHEALAAALWSEPAGEQWWLAVLRALHWLYEKLLLVVLLVTSVLAALLLSSVLAAPFNDALSERVEALVTGRPGPAFSWRALAVDVVRTVALELSKLSLYLAVMVPLWGLSLCWPAVGQLLAGVVGFVLSAYYFALDYLDWPAARRGVPLRERWRLLRRFPVLTLGFGTGVWLLMLVPGLNLLLMPAAVAGGTLLYLDLERLGAAPGYPQRADERGEDT